MMNSSHDIFANDDEMDTDMEGDDDGNGNSDHRQMEIEELERDAQLENGMPCMDSFIKNRPNDDSSNRCSKFHSNNTS